jgi:hypothetical protein
MVHACNPSIWEVKEGGSLEGAQEFKTRLYNIARPHLEHTNKKEVLSSVPRDNLCLEHFLSISIAKPSSK